MPKLCVILNNHLNEKISSIKYIDKNKDFIFIPETKQSYVDVPHHKKKLVFLISALRKFVAILESKKFNVLHAKLDDKENTGNLTLEIEKIVKKYKITELVITFPADYKTLSEIKSWKKKLNVEVTILSDDLFLSDLDEFIKNNKDKKSLIMETFYRSMRKKCAVLYDGNRPVGGKWNFDSENRKPVKGSIKISKPKLFKQDKVTKDVAKLVEKQFTSHFGDIEPFYFATTRKEALQVLKHFISTRLELFGDYQDAMLEGETWMYHSCLSFYLNCSLITPLECIQAAEQAYLDGIAPINAVEGFIRQILGWREYIRCVYWLKMPKYKTVNYFNAKRKLPEFYWDANTKLNCIKNCVSETKTNAYAHHIQRLMVLGNFALLCGINPKYVQDWYLMVYADAFEWVEMPNVVGMILYADGGFLATKPYAAGGSYINKMSNYCNNCQYDVKKKNGSDACPFNYLYWNFLTHNKKLLGKNPRLKLIYSSLNKMPRTKILAIKEDSNNFLKKL